MAGWLTIDEAAALLRVPKSWLYERTRLNTVPHVKLGKYLRFDREEFLAWARQVSPRRPRPAGHAGGADSTRHATPYEPTSAIITLTTRAASTGQDAVERHDRARGVRSGGRSLRPAWALAAVDITSHLQYCLV
jgi:excisionase family DNA binding protein